MNHSVVRRTYAGREQYMLPDTFRVITEGWFSSRYMIRDKDAFSEEEYLQENYKILINALEKFISLERPVTDQEFQNLEFMLQMLVRIKNRLYTSQNDV